VTRSEIPQLEVVTAIPDAESEDFVAQLLFSQGWSIIHRAFDYQSLGDFMRKRGAELRTVIVYQSDFLGLDGNLIAEFASPSVTFIALDSIAFNSHEIMVTIRGKLRAPMLQSGASQLVDLAAKNLTHSLESEVTADFGTFSHKRLRDSSPSAIKRINREAIGHNRDRKVIAITGSTGAPGRTRFATALAQELSQSVPILFIDADIRSHGIAAERTLASKNRIEIVPLDRENRPTQIPDGDETMIVDLGTLPGLAEAVTDRRWHGSLVNNILDRATQLIYLCKSTPASMGELTQFLREYPLLVKRLPVSYICVLSGHSRELREWESKFLTLTMGENRYILREGQIDPSTPTGILGSLKLGNPKRREIAKIATALG